MCAGVRMKIYNVLDAGYWREEMDMLRVSREGADVALANRRPCGIMTRRRYNCPQRAILKLRVMRMQHIYMYSIIYIPLISKHL